MNLTLDASEMEKLADMVADRLANRINADRPTIAEPPPKRKLFFTEREAADMLGVSAWTLKRARLAGEIAAATAGKPLRYDDESIAAAKTWLRTRGGARTN
jgi:hypothetical protein